MTDRLFELKDAEISVTEVMGKVADVDAGAINLFVGTVREMTGEKQTIYLKYEAYVPMAEKQLNKIGEEIGERWPTAKVAISHRVGELKVKDIAVVIAVSTPHRGESFDACRYAIERIKQIVPIWKKEHWADGSSWMGDQKETVSYVKGHLFGEE